MRDPWLEAWGPVLASPFAGSFMFLLVRRLPRGRPVAFARSACETCGTLLRPADLVPLLSALMLRGRCRHCSVPIAPAHWRTELAALAVGAVAAVTDGGPGRVWAGCVLGWTLLALALIDVRHFRLPDVLTLPLLLAGLAATALLQPEELTAHAAAAAAGFLLLRALAFGYLRLRGREGLGQGDAKLLGASGAWLGPGALPDVLLAAAAAGLLLALALRLRGRRVTATTALPFGPCLAAATWLVWLAGP